MTGTMSIYQQPTYYSTVTFAGVPPTSGLIDATATDIAQAGTQSAGASTLVPNSDHVHPANSGWIPAMNNLLGANGQLDAGIASNAAVTKGAVTLLKLPIWQPGTITSLWLGLEAAGSGTSSGSYVGLYSSAGVLLTGSADQVTNFTAAAPAPIQCTLGTAQSVQPGFVWALILSNLSSSQPAFFRYGGTGGAVMGNLNLTAANYRFAANGTGVTVPPGTINPASNTTTNAFALWAGWS